MKKEIKEEIISWVKNACGKTVVIIDCAAHVEVNCNYIDSYFLEQLKKKFPYPFSILGNHVSNIHSLKLCIGNV